MSVFIDNFVDFAGCEGFHLKNNNCVFIKNEQNVSSNTSKLSHFFLLSINFYFLLFPTISFCPFYPYAKNYDK